MRRGASCYAKAIFCEGSQYKAATVDSFFDSYPVTLDEATLPLVNFTFGKLSNNSAHAVSLFEENQWVLPDKSTTPELTMTAITHGGVDRCFNICRCNKCGIEEKCTPWFDFFTLEGDENGPLYCESCITLSILTKEDISCCSTED